MFWNYHPGATLFVILCLTTRRIQGNSNINSNSNNCFEQQQQRHQPQVLGPPFSPASSGAAAAAAAKTAAAAEERRLRGTRRQRQQQGRHQKQKQERQLPITDVDSMGQADVDDYDSRILIKGKSSGKSKSTRSPHPNEKPPHCGCWDCTDAIWNSPSTDAGGQTYTCGARIEWVMTTTKDANGVAVKTSEEEACQLVAGTDAATAAVCGPACNPAACDGKPTPAPTGSPGTDPTSLYCYPPNEERQSYENVWGEYLVQVKEAEGLCGPGNNHFTRDNVKLIRDPGSKSQRDSLHLLFQKVNGIWSASEVRIVHPETQFSYGTYKFSIQSVTVLGQPPDDDPLSGPTVVIASDYLPPSLVLGIFTWDDSERYDIHENFNHEVDIELSQWGNASLANAQFLVQPPGAPQLFRFDTAPSAADTTAADTATPSQQQIGGTEWSFTWNPGQIDWYTTAAGGVSHSYSTADALRAGVPDFVQCLPSPHLEVRLNLWNFLDTNTPLNLQDNHYVQVIIDHFEYIPSNLQYVPDGGTCSKDCHCSPASVCLQNVCSPRSNNNNGNTTTTPVPTPPTTLTPTGTTTPTSTVLPSLTTGTPASTNTPTNAHSFTLFPTTLAPEHGNIFGPHASCSMHTNCKGMSGDCCPTSQGIYLSCCDGDGGDGTSQSVPKECSAYSACDGLHGHCCPTDKGVFLECCGIIVTGGPSDPRPPMTVPPKASSCLAYPACHFLAGDCCPTVDGTLLDCCSKNF